MIRLLSVLILVGSASAQAPVAYLPLPANSGSGGSSPVKSTSPGGGYARTLPDLPPLPAGKATLLGGTISSVDHVRDRLILHVFGGGLTAVLFDERTRVFREGKQRPLDDLKTGERVYVDTTLDGTDIFARNIRLVAAMPTGQSNGQIVKFEPGSGELTLRDTLSPEVAKMRLGANTAILRGDRAVTLADLRPGTLVALTFATGSGEVPTVQKISILASPGAGFVFSGRVEHLDLHRGLLVVVDPRDDKTYEMKLDPAVRRLTENLRLGAEVTVQASFDGEHYEARAITVNSASSQ